MAVNSLDLLFSQLSTDRFNLELWLNYIDLLESESSSFKDLSRAYEGALSNLPGSYKLWYRYIQVRVKRCRGKHINHCRFLKTINTFEKSLVYMRRMPVIWEEYFVFSLQCLDLSQTRNIFYGSIRALPITQHTRLFNFALEHLRKLKAYQPLTTEIFENFVKIRPSKLEDFIDYLVEIDDFNRALRLIYPILEDKYFESFKKKTRHDYWLLFCNLARSNAHQLNMLSNFMNIDAIIRMGIKKYKDQAGFLWCTLAECFLKQGDFDTACQVYEEGMAHVLTVHDFTIVFDAYAQFQESLLSAKIQMVKETNEQDPEIDIYLAKLDSLLDRRPFLLNDVMLRQNPNNVPEWKKRLSLVKNSDGDIEKVFIRALESIEITKPFVGEPAEIFFEYSNFLEQTNRVKDCESIFNEALEQRNEYANQVSLVHIILYYCEFLVRIGRIDKAKQVLKSILIERKSVDSDFSLTVKRSVKLWNFKCDIEMNLGTETTVKTTFEQISTYKILTPPLILQYAAYLEEKDRYEAMFSVYERGVNAFDWPESREIWLLYLNKFCQRYEGQKLDRGRELFEQALEGCPPESIFAILLLYLNYEDRFGLFSNQMDIFNRFFPKVSLEVCFKLAVIKISRAIEYVGLLKARRVVEEVIEVLYGKVRDHEGYEYVLRICLYYSSIEKAVGEIERARAIFQYGSQFCDPRKHNFFWDAWYQLEIEHGNTNTFKEMLRVKRAAIAQFGIQSGVQGFVKSKLAPKDEELETKIEEEKHTAAEEVDSAEIQLE